MFKELVEKNRSYRGYDESVQVSRETVRELVDIAHLTPSATNLQPLKFVSVTQKEMVEQLLALTRWGGALPQLHLPYEGHHPAAFVVICQDTQILPQVRGCQIDVGIAAQTLLLAATEKGLGGCMIGNYSPHKVAQLLRLPETLIPQLVVALGKPDETVVLTCVGEDGSIRYYRDEKDVHYVPKRGLDDILIEK